MAEIKIYVNEQLDGYTYQLEPKSKALLESETSDTEPVASVFVSFDTRAQFEWTHGSLWRHVAEMLTGLTMDQLKALGKVVFVDPKTEQLLFEAVEQNV